MISERGVKGVEHGGVDSVALFRDCDNLLAEYERLKSVELQPFSPSKGLEIESSTEAKRNKEGLVEMQEAVQQHFGQNLSLNIGCTYGQMLDVVDGQIDGKVANGRESNLNRNIFVVSDRTSREALHKKIFTVAEAHGLSDEVKQAFWFFVEQIFHKHTMMHEIVKQGVAEDRINPGNIIFEKCFKERPQGKVVVVELPGGLYLRVDDLLDYVIASDKGHVPFKNKGVDGRARMLDDAKRAGGSHFQKEVGGFVLDFIVQNSATRFAAPNFDGGTFRHELEHFSIQNNDGVRLYLSREEILAAIKHYNDWEKLVKRKSELQDSLIVELRHAKSEKNKRIIKDKINRLNDLWLTRVPEEESEKVYEILMQLLIEDADNHGAQEVLAYYRNGSLGDAVSAHGRENGLLELSGGDGGMYDYLASGLFSVISAVRSLEEVLVKTLGRQDIAKMIKDFEQYKVKEISDLFKEERSKYLQKLKAAKVAIEDLEDVGFDRNEIIKILSTSRLADWPKVADLFKQN